MKNLSATQKVLFWILAILYCFALPFLVTELVLRKYPAYSSLNLSLVYLGMLVHMDVVVYLICRNLKNTREKK